MRKTIKIKARYGLIHKLVFVEKEGDSLVYKLILDESGGEAVGFIGNRTGDWSHPLGVDPPGGPELMTIDHYEINKMLLVDINSTKEGIFLKFKEK